MPRAFRVDAFRTCSIALAMLAMLFATGAQAQEPKLVPFPKTCEPGSGHLTLNAECRIVAADESLVPLANVASEEMATAVRREVPRGPRRRRKRSDYAQDRQATQRRSLRA